jgi:putative colanic acid biosynthesis glycosyltransferase
MVSCLISVVTISRNNLSGLRRTLDSVREQTYPAIEHLVIDGASEDGSQEFLKTYCHSKDFHYWSEPDTGISNAFNKGVDKSSGQLIFFLNSGDVFFSKTIVSEVVDSYLKDNWKCAQGGIISFSYQEAEVLYMPPKLPSQFLKYFMFLPHQGFFCETSLHKQYRFDESIKTSMDYDLFVRMLKGVEIFYLPTVIAKREVGGVSSQSKLRVQEHSQIRMRYAATMSEKLTAILINMLVAIKDNLKITSPFAREWKG